MQQIVEFLTLNGNSEYGEISKRHWALLDEIIADQSPSTICHTIQGVYTKQEYSRHQAALLISMIVWCSSEYDDAISNCFNEDLMISNPTHFGVLISRNIEWFPFGDPEGTLENIHKYRQTYPQFKEDFDYWETLAREAVI